MPGILPHLVLLALGGDVLQKYGTLIKRSAPPARGGETPYTFARTGTGLYVAQDASVQAAATNVPRIEWGTDPVAAVLQPYLLLEPAATNVVLRNRDLSNAAWTKASITAVLNQVGIDGAVNSATSLTATGANGTCLQAITLGSAARFQSAWVKRLTGSGTINMTMDNGATWTVIPVTTAWTRVAIPPQTLANPTVGFRLVTSGDAIAVDGVQNEAGLFQTSTIFTTTVAVTRNTESFTIPWYDSPAPRWRYTRFLERGTALTGLVDGPRITATSPNTAEWLLQGRSGNYSSQHHNNVTSVASTLAVGPVYGNLVEILELLNADGSVTIRQSINGAADTAAGPSAPLAYATQWGTPQLVVNGPINAFTGAVALSRLLLGMGPGTLIATLADARAVPL